jgi:hypothetical protein
MPKSERARRAGSGLGTIRQRPDGRWEYRFSVKREDGTSSRKSVYGASQKETVTEGKKLEEQYRKGLVPKRDGRTFGGFAQDWYAAKPAQAGPVTPLDGIGSS